MATLAETIRALNLRATIDLLNVRAAGEVDGREVVDTMLRTTSLILHRPEPARERKRDAFLDGLGVEVARRFGAALGHEFAEARNQLRIAEDGYRRILAHRGTSELAQLPPNAQAAAVLARGAQASRRIQSEVKALYRTGRASVQAPVLTDSAGDPIPADAIVEAEVSVVSSTLAMQAIEQGWLQGDIIVLPDLPPVSDDERALADRNAYTASAWSAWRRTEERARFLGGRLVEHSVPNLPVDAGDSVERVYELQGGSSLWFDWAARLRLSDGAAQSAVELIVDREFPTRIGDIDKRVARAPEAFVSHGEVLAVGLLSEALSYNVLDDDTLVDGLRIADWLRGMAILSRLAERRVADPIVEDDPLLPRLSEAEIVDPLLRGGLDRNQSVALIDALTFRRTSVDLFDAPIIKLADGRHLLFGPALVGQNHANVLLSIFSRKEVVFDDKGKAFEDRVIRRLTAEGLQARSIDVRRDGARYEFDVVAVWGEHVFLFECKNRSVPAESPVQSRRFADELRRHARQTLRLKHALETWPQIFEDAFGFPLGERRIIPCVLHNLPYARIGEHHGVYFYEYSALARFFDSRCLNLKTYHHHGKRQGRIMTEIETLPIWQGDAPTSHDLLREIQAPFQLRIIRHHSREVPLRFQLDPETAVSAQEFVRDQVTPFSIASMAGISRRKIKLAFEKAERRARKSRRRDTSGANVGRKFRV